MALLDSEVYRLKAELGYPLLTIGSVPYVAYTALFEQVVQVYLSAGATTSSSTAVTAATTATPVTLTLASATGFSVFSRVIVDVDDRQESATVSAVSGNTITVLLKGAHSGTYPVTVEGGEAIVRDILKNLATVKKQIASLVTKGGLKRAEDIEWYEAKNGVGGSAALQDAYKLLAFWRDELAAALGVPNLWRSRGVDTLTPALY
jgi:hypothetical protein